MFDNSPEDNDGGLDQDQMDDLALLLANTKRDLREVVEQLGWEWDNEISAEMQERVDICDGCGFWVPVAQAGDPSCAMCMELRQPEPGIVSDADQRWLKQIHVGYDE
jgi:hypothetical protein